MALYNLLPLEHDGEWDVCVSVCVSCLTLLYLFFKNPLMSLCLCSTLELVLPEINRNYGWNEQHYTCSMGDGDALSKRIELAH